MFKKKEIFKVKSVPLDPGTMNNPTTAQDFTRRGMAYYARKIYDSAAQDLKHACELDPKSVDAFYGLGMVYKAARMNKEAVEVFEQAVELIKAEMLLEGEEKKDHEKHEMLRRLALGHINEIKSGDWNLEKEIWQHIQ